MALPFVRDGIAFLGWVAFVPLLFALEGAPPGRAFLLGWIAGLVTHLVGFYWIPGLLVRFASMPLVAALPLWGLLAAWGGVMYAFVALLASLLGRRHTELPPLVVLPLAYMAVEMAFPQVFPWTLAGGQYMNVHFIQSAQWVGTLGLAGMLVLASGCVFELVVHRSGLLGDRKPRPWWALGGILLVLTMLFAGNARLAQVQRMRDRAPAMRVGVVQPNVGIDVKGKRNDAPEQLEELARMTAELQDRGAQLAVWPETSYPYRIHRQHRTQPSGDRRIVRGFSIPVLFGAVSFDETGRYNSAFVAGPGGALSAPADKIRLVLFSERIPGKKHIPSSWIRKYRFLSGGFEPGRAPGVLEVEDARLGVLNCFEDTFPASGRALARAGANVLVNLTNDAWFGDTAEPRQHLALSVFRAVETRRDLVRSVNTGISAVVHATGRIEKRTGTFEKTSFVHDVRLMEGTTLYIRAGPWVGWASLGALVLLGCWATIRRRGARAPAPAKTEVEDETSR